MNLYSRLAQLARYQPDKPAIETPQGRQLGYRELDALARSIAGGLREHGVGAGDAVGLRLKDTPEHVAAFFAVMRLGAAILPLDWRGTSAEFERVTGQFQPRVVVSDAPPPAGASHPVVDVHELLGRAPDEGPAAEITDMAMGLSLTSGTTGAPKAFVVTHEQLHARCMTRSLEGIFGGEDRWVETMPLAYPAGREHSICMILLGGTLLMFPHLFEPAEIANFVNSSGATVVALSPNALRAQFRARLGDGLQMPGLRTLFTGTSKLQPDERAIILERVTPRLIDCYGNTGVGAISVIDRQEDGVEETSVGRPVIGIEIEAVDDADNPLPRGEVGHLRIRGPAVSTRSAGAVADERESYRDGWYYPGDLGRVAENGLLHLHGRSADLIKRGGLMVHAQEVEQALRRHPDIEDAAVVGRPSETLGQEVTAFVIARTPVETQELVRHCRRELAPYKVPSRIEFREELPRNVAGKVVKASLIEELKS